MQTVPLAAVPAQTIYVQLDGQAFKLNIYQKRFGLFADIFLNNTLVLSGVLCLNEVRMIRDSYFGIAGDFMFYDNQSSSDPDYTGLASRFSLLYLAAADLPS